MALGAQHHMPHPHHNHHPHSQGYGGGGSIHGVTPMHEHHRSHAGLSAGVVTDAIFFCKYFSGKSKRFARRDIYPKLFCAILLFQS